ncbi:MAG TPA: hypothetical protein PKZ56_02465 [Candidatus Paceibacterota bacterium]|nr:hypothetical protein [Candidatus Paceibacterota bacterium]
MKKLIILITVFCMFSVKNISAQNNGFSVISDPLTGKQVLAWQGKPASETKSFTQTLSKEFDEINHPKAILWNDYDGGKRNKCLFVYNGYKWYLVKEHIYENFTITLEERDVTLVVHLVYPTGNTEDIYL